MVVGTDEGRVHIWQYISPSFTLLGSWATKNDEVEDVDFIGNYIILRSADGLQSKPINVHYFSGEKCYSIPCPVETYCMALHENHLITGDDEGTLQVWDIHTGSCLTELKGEKDCIHSVDGRNGVIASHDDQGRTIIWSTQAEAALAGKQFCPQNAVHHRTGFAIIRLRAVPGMPK